MLALLLSLAILPTTSRADATDANLFGVHKPVHAENVLEVQARMNGCIAQNIDFLWFMNVGANGKPEFTKRSQAEDEIRKRFQLRPSSSSNAASCAKAVPAGTKCSSFAVSAAEIGWVQTGLTDPSLIVRADMSSGSCHAGAYLDLGSRVIEIDSLTVRANNVHIHSMLGLATTGADFDVVALDVKTKAGDVVTFPCRQSCHKSEGM
jgi:hypothetical protein